LSGLDAIRLRRRRGRGREEEEEEEEDSAVLVFDRRGPPGAVIGRGSRPRDNLLAPKGAPGVLRVGTSRLM
jgi:hypothetical protein